MTRFTELTVPAAGRGLQRHDCDELLYTDVPVRIRCGQQSFSLLAGDILCIPAGTEHTSLPEAEPLELQTQEPPFRSVCQVHDSTGMFADLMRMTRQASGRHTTDWEVYASGLGIAMYRLVLCMQAELPRPNLAALQLRQAIERSGTDPDFDLNAAMKKTGYCAGHLRQLFREAYGIPPLTYLNEFRVGFAKAQLRAGRGSVSIHEVSQNCGFHDSCYFSRIFRRLTGLTPTEYLSSLPSEPER